jgi:hypothetical protein
VLAVSLMLVFLAGAGIWFVRDWPFSRTAITRDLGQRLRGRLTIRRFRETWFPPGADMGDIKVTYGPRGQREAPEITVRDLVIRGSWHGLFTHTISNIQLLGLRIKIPAGESARSLFLGGAKSKVKSLAELQINDASFDSQSLKFRANELVLDDLGHGETVRFRGFVVTDKPHGELKGEGRAGPVNTLSLDAIPLSGTFQYANADLSVFTGLRGILVSQGRFGGNMGRINVTGSLNVPAFHINGSAHSVDFQATYEAAVNTRNADTELKQVEARVARTTIDAMGTVNGSPGKKGKTARLQLAVDKGRVEDLLDYFSEQQRPSMTGAVKLRATAELPPGPPAFLRRVHLTGDFGVAGGRLTNTSRQTSINDLSATAWKKETHEKESKADDDARTAVSDLKGHVVVQDGTADLKNVSFEFPGAHAEMAGTFQLIHKTIDIRGTLQTTGSISGSASGFKALVLKVATPFMKKKKTTVVPFVIKGTSSNPKLGLDLGR